MSLMGINIGAPATVGHIVNVAELYGLSAGTIVDFTGQSSGTAWDFSLEDHRQAARDRICSTMPMVIIGTDIRNVQGVEWGRQQAHLSFLRELYKYQGSVGRYFIHEQSLGSMSWYDGVIPDLIGSTGIYHWEGQVETGGFTVFSGFGLGWISNSMSIVQELETFSALAPSVAKTPRVGALGQGGGPHALAKALLRGLHIQLLITGEFLLNTVGVEVAEEEHDFQEMLLDEWSTYQDDVTGIPLVD